MFTIIKHLQAQFITFITLNAHFHVIVHAATVGDTPTIDAFTDPSFAMTISVNDITFMVARLARVSTVD